MISRDFHERISIQQKTAVDDSFGQPNEDWDEVCEVWAKVTYMKPSERYRSQAIHSIRSATFTIRYFPDLDENMRIYYQNVYWKITGISELQRKKYWDISAETVQITQ